MRLESLSAVVRGFSRRKTITVAIVLVILLIAPFSVSFYWENVLDVVLLACLGSLALNLILGVAGQVSMGNAAFLAVGGLAAAQFGGIFHWPFVPTLIVSGLCGAVVGILVGMPSLRIRGIYLLVSTLALQYVIVYAFYEYQTKKDLVSGFPIPAASIGSFKIVDYQDWYWVLAVIVVLVYVALSNLMRGVYGRAWLMVRDAEVAATVLGVNVGRYKLSAFAISAFINSLQGALLAYYNNFASSDTYGLSLAVQYAAMVVIGGLGSMVGAVIGAIIVSAAPYALTEAFGSTGQLPNYELLLYGVAMVGFFILAPDGVVGIARRSTDRVRGILLQRGTGGADVPTTTQSPALATGAPQELGKPSGAGARHARTVPPSVAAEASALEVTGLAAAYGSVGRVLHEVSLHVNSSEIVAVLGPNGAGKTTLLRSIGGFGPGEPGRVVSGSVRYRGQTLSGRQPHEIARRGVATIPERNKIFTHLTILENLQAVGHGTRAQHKEALEYIFDLFPVLHERQARQAGLLSGGERQMLAIGRALMLDPSLILADELSFGIAPVLIDRLCEALEQINRERGVGILLVEQNTTAAFSIAKRVYVLDSGNVVMHGPVETISEMMDGGRSLTPQLRTVGESAEGVRR